MQRDSCQKAGKGAINPRRKSLHLNALDSFLPSQTNRENLVHSRDEGDISFRKSEMSALPLKADVLGLSTEVRYVPEADMRSGRLPCPAAVKNAPLVASRQHVGAE